jgi:hypothetical protein
VHLAGSVELAGPDAAALALTQSEVLAATLAGLSGLPPSSFRGWRIEDETGRELGGLLSPPASTTVVLFEVVVSLGLFDLYDAGELLDLVASALKDKDYLSDVLAESCHCQVVVRYLNLQLAKAYPTLVPTPSPSSLPSPVPTSVPTSAPTPRPTQTPTPPPSPAPTPYGCRFGYTNLTCGAVLEGQLLASMRVKALPLWVEISSGSSFQLSYSMDYSLTFSSGYSLVGALSYSTAHALSLGVEPTPVLADFALFAVEVPSRADYGSALTVSTCGPWTGAGVDLSLWAGCPDPDATDSPSYQALAIRADTGACPAADGGSGHGATLTAVFGAATAPTTVFVLVRSLPSVSGAARLPYRLSVGCEMLTPRPTGVPTQVPSPLPTEDFIAVVQVLLSDDHCNRPPCLPPHPPTHPPTPFHLHSGACATMHFVSPLHYFPVVVDRRR